MAPLHDAMTISLSHEGPMHCPQCGADEMHFDEVSIIDPSRNIAALHADGMDDLSVVTAMVSNDQDSSERHFIVLPHWCGSCGARGEIVLRQHDGRTSGQYRATDVPSAARQ